jgi:acetolactate synthase I/II/III large subunit
MMATLGEVLVRELARRGVTVVFGIPGVHTIELYRGLAGSGIRHVTPRHEQGAGFMADGYARATGKPGVAFVISGPGITNILTPMAQARADSVPMLVISSDNPRDTRGQGRGFLHELPDQQALVRQVALLSLEIAGPDDLIPVLDHAFAPLTGGRGGPVHIMIPRDVLSVPYQGPLPEGAEPLPVPALPPQDAIAAAAALLEQARAPVILVGGGGKGAEGPLRAMAEWLDAPVVQTVNGRGLLHGHPLLVPASPSLVAVRTLIDAADQILAIGTELGPTDYDMYATGSYPDLSRLIRIDIDAEQIERHLAGIGLCGDAGATLGALLVHLPRQDRREGSGQVRAKAAREAALVEVGPKMQDQVGILCAIRDAVPGAIFVGDSTQPVYAGNLWFDHDLPGGWFNAATGYGALGYGIPAAIGAAIGRPDAPVICLSGDGGAQFSLPEIMAAVDEKLSVIFVVWNNRAYREIAESMQAAGVEIIGCDPTPPGFAAIALACGIPFRRCDPDGPAVASAIRDSLTGQGPAMIEITVP